MQASLRKKILSDQYNKIIFGSGSEEEIYLVGGYIRDLLLKRKCLDRDFVIQGPFKSVLSRIASVLGTKAVSIGGKGLFRIIVPKKITLDFSPIRKEIQHDLAKRDFTINAMAWTPATGLIDEGRGLEDLARKSLRMISATNLGGDPVRVIRAYRLAATLSFNIESATRKALMAFAALIKQAKRERITLEFFKILNLTEPERALRLMQEDGVLAQIIFHDNGILQGNIRAFSRLGRNLNGLPLKYRKMLHSEFSQNLSHLGFFYLSLLMRGLPNNMFSLSSKILKYLELNEKGTIFYRQKEMPSKENLFDLFRITRSMAPFFLITNNLSIYLPEYERYLRVSRKTILSADHIRDITGLSDGERLGSIITTLKRAQFMRLVMNKTEALRFLKQISIE